MSRDKKNTANGFGMRGPALRGATALRYARNSREGLILANGSLSTSSAALKLPGRIRRFLSQLGPGLISGAANDDPSCISTYCVAAAAFGYATLWTSVFCFPLVGAVQYMCSRLGMVTGRGLAGVVRLNYPRWVLFSTCGALVGANVINIGADLAGMGEATELITGISSYIWTPIYTAGIVAMLFWSTYRTIVGVFKWLTLILFSYVIAGFLARPDWLSVLRTTFIPAGEISAEYLSVLVGIFGATMSPYLLFWQASQEVEEEYSQGRKTVSEREGATEGEIERSRTDVIMGALVSRLITYFITLTTAATLFAHGHKKIATAQQAAEALRPLAGEGAYWLFSLGLIGTGMLGVPVLAGSSAYAVAEAARWRGSLEHKPGRARRFYTVLGFSMALGLALKYLGFSAVGLLFWSAVINGALAPPLILLVLLLTSNRDVMAEHVNSRAVRRLGWATFTATLLAALGMFAAFLIR